MPRVSPVLHLLKSNNEPNTAEIFATKRAIECAQREVDDLISLPLTDHGRSYLAQLVSFIRAHQAVLSPIRCIPVELLSKIFVYVTLHGDIDVKHPPLNLSQVSRLWRVAVLSSPLIFTVLPPMQLTKHTASSGSLYQLESFIKKAPSNSLLSFEIADFVSEPVHPVVTELIAQPERWNSISLKLDHSLFRQLNPLLIHRVSNLRKLHLKIRPSSIGVYGSLSAFEDAPALQEVDIDCPGPMLLRLPWRQLTTYKERSLSTIGVTLLLRDGAAVEHCVYSCSEESPIPFLLAPARVSCLKIMDIRLYHDKHDIPFRLTTPSLEELRLRDHAPDAINDLIQLFNRSFCGLTMRRLSFHVKTLSSGDLSKVLLLLPNLEELECNDIPTDDLQHLSRETAGLVPRLRKLVIHQPSHLSEIDMLITSRSYFRFPRTLESDSDVTSGLVSARLFFPIPEDCDRASLGLGAEGYERQTVVVVIDALTQLHAIVDAYKTKGKWKKRFGHSFSDRKEALQLNAILTSLEKYKFESFPQLEVRRLVLLSLFSFFF